MSKILIYLHLLLWKHHKPTAAEQAAIDEEERAFTSMVVSLKN